MNLAIRFLFFFLIACGIPSSILAQAPNDECINAMVLNINSNTSCTLISNSSTTDASNSGIPACTGTANNDVWFSFVASSMEHQIELSNIVNIGTGTSSSTDLVQELFSDCSGTSIACSDPNVAIYSGLSIGTTYYLRIFGWFSSIQNVNFDLCVTTPPIPPSNDECSNALPLTVNIDFDCGTITQGTTVHATASGFSACTGTPNNDVWFSFVATESIHKIEILKINNLGTNSSSSNVMAHELFSNCSGNSVGCSNSGTTTHVYKDLVIGATYYLRVYGWEMAFQDINFEVCIGTVPPPPINDECLAAIPLAVNQDLMCTLSTSGTITAATTSNPSTTCLGSADDDVWFSFVATDERHGIVLNNIWGTVTNLYFEVLEGDCMGGLTSLLCSDDEVNYLDDLTIGTTYFLRLYTLTAIPEQIVDFDVCIHSLPFLDCESIPTNCFNASTLSEGYADFDDWTLGDWEQMNFEELDWTINFGSTGSVGTGPAGDLCPNAAFPAANNGNYIYFEASGQSLGDQACIENTFDFRGIEDDMELSFWYHMYGACMGSINVYINSIPTLTISGEQMSSENDPWQQVSLPLPKDSLFAVWICASLPITCPSGQSFEADAAIDRIVVYQCNEPIPCPPNYAGTNQLIGKESDIKTYQTNGIIESTQSISSTATIDYNSGQEINLLPDFEVELGAVFHAFIEGCIAPIPVSTDSGTKTKE